MGEWQNVQDRSQRGRWGPASTSHRRRNTKDSNVKGPAQLSCLLVCTEHQRWTDTQTLYSLPRMIFTSLPPRPDSAESSNAGSKYYRKPRNLRTVSDQISGPSSPVSGHWEWPQAAASEEDVRDPAVGKYGLTHPRESCPPNPHAHALKQESLISQRLCVLKLIIILGIDVTHLNAYIHFESCSILISMISSMGKLCPKSISF